MAPSGQLEAVLSALLGDVTLAAQKARLEVLAKAHRYLICKAEGTRSSGSSGRGAQAGAPNNSFGHLEASACTAGAAQAPQHPAAEGPSGGQGWQPAAEGWRTRNTAAAAPSQPFTRTSGSTPPGQQGPHDAASAPEPLSTAALAAAAATASPTQQVEVVPQTPCCPVQSEPHAPASGTVQPPAAAAADADAAQPPAGALLSSGRIVQVVELPHPVACMVGSADGRLLASVLQPRQALPLCRWPAGQQAGTSLTRRLLLWQALLPLASEARDQPSLELVAQLPLAIAGHTADATPLPVRQALCVASALPAAGPPQPLLVLSSAVQVVDPEVHVSLGASPGGRSARGCTSPAAASPHGVQLLTPRRGSWHRLQQLSTPSQTYCVAAAALPRGNGIAAAATAGKQQQQQAALLVAAGGPAGSAHVWGLQPDATAVVLSKALPQAVFKFYPFTDIVELCFAPSRPQLLLGVSSGGSLAVWDALQGSLLAALHIPLAQLSCVQIVCAGGGGDEDGGEPEEEEEGWAAAGAGGGKCSAAPDLGQGPLALMALVSEQQVGSEGIRPSDTRAMPLLLHGGTLSLGSPVLVEAPTALHARGALAAVGTASGVVHVWDVLTGSALAGFVDEDDQAQPVAAALLLGNSMLVTAADACLTLQQWSEPARHPSTEAASVSALVNLF